MKKNKFIQALLLFLFLVYFSQGLLYSKTFIISQIALASIILISIYYLIKTLIQNIYKSPFFWIWSLLLFLNFFGYLITGDLSNTDHFGMLKGILLSSLSFFPFYYFARTDCIEINFLKKIFIVLLPIMILRYYYLETQILSERISGNNMDVVNNTAYGFTVLIPFAFLFKKKKIIANVFMVIIMFFIIQGAKRGALITGVIGFLFFIYFQFQNIEKKHKVFNFLLLFFGIGFMIYYLLNFFQSNEYLLLRLASMEEGYSSGRNIIYASILNGWMDGNFLQLLFGFGFASSISFAGNFAHNDWLELLSNFGITGVMLYFILFYFGFRASFTKKWNKSKKIMLLCVMMMWLSTSLVSMGYTSLDNGYLRSIILACLIGSASKEL